MTLKELQQQYNKYSNLINTLNYYDSRRNAGFTVPSAKYAQIKAEINDLGKRFKKISHLFEFELTPYLYKCLEILNKFENNGANWTYTYILTSSNMSSPYTYEVALYKPTGESLTFANISSSKPLSYTDNATINLLYDTCEPFDLCTSAFCEKVNVKTSQALKEAAWNMVAAKQKAIVSQQREQIDAKVSQARSQLTTLMKQQSAVYKQKPDSFNF